MRYLKLSFQLIKTLSPKERDLAFSSLELPIQKKLFRTLHKLSSFPPEGKSKIAGISGIKMIELPELSRKLYKVVIDECAQTVGRNPLRKIMEQLEFLKEKSLFNHILPLAKRGKIIAEEQEAFAEASQILDYEIICRSGQQGLLGRIEALRELLDEKERFLEKQTEILRLGKVYLSGLERISGQKEITSKNYLTSLEDSSGALQSCSARILYNSCKILNSVYESYWDDAISLCNANLDFFDEKPVLKQKLREQYIQNFRLIITIQVTNKDLQDAEKSFQRFWDNIKPTEYEALSLKYQMGFPFLFASLSDPDSDVVKTWIEYFHSDLEQLDLLTPRDSVRLSFHLAWGALKVKDPQLAISFLDKVIDNSLVRVSAEYAFLSHLLFIMALIDLEKFDQAITQISANKKRLRRLDLCNPIYPKVLYVLQKACDCLNPKEFKEKLSEGWETLQKKFPEILTHEYRFDFLMWFESRTK